VIVAAARAVVMIHSFVHVTRRGAPQCIGAELRRRYGTETLCWRHDKMKDTNALLIQMIQKFYRHKGTYVYGDSKNQLQNLCLWTTRMERMYVGIPKTDGSWEARLDYGPAQPTKFTIAVGTEPL
jgi:hypothetical protein